MVLKTTLCRFSGLRIWPGRGMLFIRTDNQQYLFLNKKCKSMYNNRLRPAKLAWTTTYRFVGGGVWRDVGCNGRGTWGWWVVCQCGLGWLRWLGPGTGC